MDFHSVKDPFLDGLRLVGSEFHASRYWRVPIDDTHAARGHFQHYLCCNMRPGNSVSQRETS